MVSFAVLKAMIDKRTPLKVTQYLTYRCNLTCSFCGRRLIQCNEMTTDQAKACMTEFREIGTMFWGFNGGEPLIRHDIGELISFAKKIGLKVSISTNGILVQQKIDQIKKIDMALISIDGPKEIHDSIRGEGNFEKAVKGIEILKDNNVKTVLLTVLHKDNLAHLDSVISLSEKYNASVEFQPVVVHRGDLEENAKKYFPSQDKFDQAINWLISQKNEGRPIMNSIEYLKELKHYPNNKMDVDCWASRLFCSISPDGRVLPCSELLSHEKNYSSGLEIGFKKAFHKLPDMKKCRECFFSCYGEYNVALAKPISTFFRATNNIIKKKWMWQ